jgi:hypothetical protein
VGLFNRYEKIVEQNAVQEWIGLAYEVLKGGDQSGHANIKDRRRKGPLETFKIEKYKKGSNLFASFQYRYWLYLKAAVINERRIDKGGLKGYNLSKFNKNNIVDISLLDIESKDYYCSDRILEEMAEEKDFSLFCHKLKKLSLDPEMLKVKTKKDMSANDILKNIFKMVKQDPGILSIKEVVNRLGRVQYSTFRNKLVWALSYMNNFGITPNNFSKFLQGKYIDRIIHILEV